MANSTIVVTNPVLTPNAAQLGQKAIDIATVIATGCRAGSYLDLYDAVNDLASAIVMLGNAITTINNTTASSVGSVNVRNAYATNQPVATNINTAAV